MKKITLLLSFIILASCYPFMKGYSVKHTILVGNYYFNPSTLNNVNLGDTIRWQWVQGTHTTTSTSIPSGAASWNEPISSSSQVYEYKTTEPGTYNYVCTPHAGMGQVGTFTVNSAAPLTVSASASPSLICMGGSSLVACFPEGGTGSYIYSWVSSPPGFTSNQQSFNVSPMQNTTYTVTVTSGSQTASASASVTIQMQCSVSCQSDTSYCNDVTSFPVSANASFYNTVNWTTSGDGTFENGTSLDAVYSPGPNDIVAGMVTLVCNVTPMAPCMMPASDNVSIVLETCTGINKENKGGISLHSYPNPSDGRFTLTTGPLEVSGTIRIIDMQGRVVHEERIAANGNGSSVQLSVPGLPSGLYQVSLISGVQTGSARLIIR